MGINEGGVIMQFEKLMETLDYAPRMETYAVKLVNGQIAAAELFKIKGDDEMKLREELATTIIEFIGNKQPIVRKLPMVTEDENGGFVGYARIAAFLIQG
jgi:hypothetical protein